MPHPLPTEMRQILTPEGKLIADPPELPPEQLRSFYRWMVFGRAISDRMLALQRQGRMGTFGPLNGQEAASVGMAAPLQRRSWGVTVFLSLPLLRLRNSPKPAPCKGFAAA